MKLVTFNVEIPDDAHLGPAFLVTFYRDDGIKDGQRMILTGATIKYDLEQLVAMGSTQQDWIAVMKSLINEASRAGGN